MTTPSLQDYSLIDTSVEKIKDENQLKDKVSGFYYFLLELLFGLQPDEIDDAITDSNYQNLSGKISGHDRGVDAVFVDSTTTPPTVNILGFKYALSFEKTGGHYPSSETEKILNFIHSVMRQDPLLKTEINPKLYEKVEEIWDLFRTNNPNFVIHLCSNRYLSLEPEELSRFERELRRFSNFSLKSHLATDIVRRLTKQGKETVNSKIRAIDYNHFEKTDGDVRAVIFCSDAREILKMVIADESLRNNSDIQDYTILSNSSILDDAFEDNVRIYLSQKSNINKNIFQTAISEENHRFFYFNNGVTLTCKKYRYQKAQRNPVIEIDELQVVNGSQTIHALFEAFKNDPTKFKHIEILCRVYETDNLALSGSIAEYTNSQNPVESRDIRSNDFVQRKLEQELSIKGFYYERKRGLYSEKPGSLRIDAEKAGQVLMTMYHNMPAEAKDNKKLIFGEKYSVIFNQNLTADQLLLSLHLFERIEKLLKEKISDGSAQDYLPHASYYILYVLKKISESKDISLSYENLEKIWDLYPEAIVLINNAVNIEKSILLTKYNHRTFFKGNRPKNHLTFP